jgi:hypothetical protein
MDESGANDRRQLGSAAATLVVLLALYSTYKVFMSGFVIGCTDEDTELICSSSGRWGAVAVTHTVAQVLLILVTVTLLRRRDLNGQPIWSWWLAALLTSAVMGWGAWTVVSP